MAPGSNLYKIFFLFFFYHIFLFLCFSVSASLGPCKLQGEDNVIPLTGTTGRLFSPLYPKIHPPNMTCAWMITVSEWKICETENIILFSRTFLISWNHFVGSNLLCFQMVVTFGFDFTLQMRNIWEALGSMQFSRLSANVSWVIVKFSYKPVKGWVQARAQSQSVGCIFFSRKRKETSLWSLTNENRLLWSRVITRNETEFKNHVHRQIKRWAPNLTFNLCRNFIGYQQKVVNISARKNCLKKNVRYVIVLMSCLER